MNWLIYIGGWFLGAAVLNKLIKPENNIQAFYVNIMWVLFWVGICWKFI